MDELEATATTMPEPVRKPSADTPTEALIYVGPNMHTRGILTYQVSEHRPTEVEDFANTNAGDIRQLVVPISKVQDTRQALENPNSLERVYFNVVLEQYEKEVRERNV